MKTRKNLCFFAVTGEDGYHETKAEEESYGSRKLRGRRINRRKKLVVPGARGYRSEPIRVN